VSGLALARLRRWVPDWLSWLALAGGVGAALFILALRPSSWRRPARVEFVRFLDLTAWRAVPAVTGAAVLIGIGLVAQGLYWLERFGDLDAVYTILATVLIREIAPLLVGLLVLGRGGLLILGELATMQREGQCRALDAQGVDPFLAIALPRVAALPVAMFSLSMLFVVVAQLAGYAVASALGVSRLPPERFVETMIQVLGAQGYLVLPLKSLLIGVAIGVVCLLTAVERWREVGREDPVPTGFLRAVLATFLATGLVSAL
jgi:phospholipid/cholesterol/gamma-HCH transport system permease protein